MMSKDKEYCNWEFIECLTPKNKWSLKRDCKTEMETISRGSGKNWKAYESSLEPRPLGHPPSVGAKCPSCGKYVNGVNPYDDGETWRK